MSVFATAEEFDESFCSVELETADVAGEGARDWAPAGPAEFGLGPVDWPGPGDCVTCVGVLVGLSLIHI